MNNLIDVLGQGDDVPVLWALLKLDSENSTGPCAQLVWLLIILLYWVLRIRPDTCLPFLTGAPF